MTILNTLYNGDFEDAGAGTTGWTSSGGTRTRQTSGGSQGAAYLQASIPSSGEAWIRGPFMPCVEGHTVRFGADIKLPVVAGVWELRYSWYTGAQTYISDSTAGANPITLTTSWARYSPAAITVPVGVGAEYFRARFFRVSGGGSNQLVDIDAVVYTAQHKDLTATLDVAWLAFVERPSFILWQLDDTPLNIMPYCDAYNTMCADGINFGFNTIGPICGPSRAALLTMQPPNVTGINRNDSAAQLMLSGGWEPLTFLAIARHHGYVTGLSGKWNNNQKTDGAAGWPDNHCPVGIDDWYSTDDDGFSQHGDYKVSIRKAGVSSKYTTTFADTGDYADTLQEEHALTFLADRDAETMHQPFILMINTRSTHDRSSPDPEGATLNDRPKHPERFDFRPLRGTRPGTWPPLDPDYEAEGYLGEVSPGVLRTGADIPTPIAPNVPDWEDGWNVVPDRYLAWHTGDVRTAGELAATREDSFEQIRMLQSVNELIENVTAEAASLGFANLHRILMSDNGMRGGWQALSYGKQVHYRSSVELPLVWVGPGVDAGVEFYTDDRIFNQLDIGPTILDLALATTPVLPGRSLQPFFDGVGPAEWRITGFCQYRTPGVAWDSHVGDGEPGGWAGLHSKHKWYTTYNPGSGVPPGTRAEFYGLDADPGQTNNIWAFAGAYSEAINTHYQAYFAATGEDFWQQGLIELVGPEDEDDGDEVLPSGRWLVNDYDISTRATNVRASGALLTAAGRRGSDLVVPGYVGSRYTMGVVGSAHGVLKMWARGCNADGSFPSGASAVALVRDNLDFLDLLFDVSTVNGTNNMIPIVREYPDGQSRTSHMHVRDAINYAQETAGALAEFAALIELPRGGWYDGAEIEETQPFDKPVPGGIARFEETAGATGHTQDFTLTFTGKFPGLQFADAASGETKARYTGDLNTNETLRIDNFNRKAYWTNAAGTVTEDHSHLIERVRGPGGGPWLTLVPSLHFFESAGFIGCYRVDIDIDDDVGSEAVVTLKLPLGRWFKRA